MEDIKQDPIDKNITIKEEDTNEDQNIDIKIEQDTLNLYDDIQIKNELTIRLEQDDSQSSQKDEEMANVSQKDQIMTYYVSQKVEDMTRDSPKVEDMTNDSQKVEDDSHDNEDNMANDSQDNEAMAHDSQESFEIKQEEVILPNENDVKQEDDDEMYDYHSFDDSMDSSEAAALTQVEACLEDDNVKTEKDFDDKNFPATIKDESELAVTETHLISNKVINTTSTITNTLDGIIQSQTTKTLIMEIHPLCTNMKVGNPEEILPTHNIYSMECNEPFQLNSITGNILSLEQEAYGLLEKKQTYKVATLKCDKCPKVCRNSSGMRNHQRVHESIERMANGIKKRIETMKARRAEKDDVLHDDMEEKKPIKKEDGEGYYCTCGKVFRRRSRMETCLRSHTEYADAEYACTTCDKKFKSKELLIYHRNKQHRKKYPCKFCPTDYQTQKELFKHLQAHQKVQLIEYKVILEVAKGNQELQCLLCSKTCSKLSDFKTHIMEGHKEPYNCPHCNQTFSTLIDFSHHVRKMHPDVGSESVLDIIEAFSKLVKAWKCDECGKQFHKADKLALHQIEEHSPDMKNEQHFQCEDCQRVFISMQGLNSHSRMHHRSEPAEVPEPEEVGVMCLECRKMCSDMNALTSHMRLHSMDRKYPCKYCDFRFTTPQKRKAHSEVHTGDMKYVCFICEYTCSSENRLKQHKMSIKHANMKEYLLTGKPLIEEEPSTSKKEKIKSERSVKKRKKDREVRVECDICGEKFSSDKDMQDHKQTHPFIEFPNDDKPSRIFFK